MPAHRIADLPAAPPGKHGWPWDEVPTRDDVHAREEGPWPAITIVTPSFNQGEFIEQTLRSVLLQGYPRVEYIVVDGASTDDTPKVLDTYRPFLDHLISEPDRGQSHAINKGLDLATGSVFAWLNSDDHYLPGTLHAVARSRREHPTAGAWCGGGRQIDARNQRVLWEKEAAGLGFEDILRNGFYLPQPSCFLNRTLLGDDLRIDECLEMQMDFDLWLRVAQHHRIERVPGTLSESIRHPGAKTAFSSPDLRYRAMAERWTVLGRYESRDRLVDEIHHYLAQNLSVRRSLRRVFRSLLGRP
jgi:glycosyltransferase involved in cell wall biosynthesis